MENKVYDVVEGLIQKLKATQEDVYKRQALNETAATVKKTG